MKIVKPILSVLFGLMFVNAGVDKFFHYMPMPEMSPEVVKAGEAMVTIKWLIPLIGLLKF